MRMPKLSFTLPACVKPLMELDLFVTKCGVRLVGHWLCVLCCLLVVGFAWLVMWCLSVTEPSNVISILISSEFLKMDTLVSVVTCDARCCDGLWAVCFSDFKRTGNLKLCVRSTQTDTAQFCVHCRSKQWLS